MKRSFILGLILGAAITCVAFALSSEMTSSMDPVNVSPQLYKVLLENDQVRVLEYRLKPGEKEEMHTHSTGVLYSLGAGRLRSTVQGGSATELDAKEGEVHWREPVTHSIENIGTTELHAIVVDLKKTCN